MEAPSGRLYPDATASSSGVPIVQGVAVGERQVAVDAMKLLDAQTAAILGGVGAFTIVQRPSLTEACCANVCERSNVYDVYDGLTGQHIFYAKERSHCCLRQLCSPRHSLFVELKPSPPQTPPTLLHRIDIDTLPTAMTMEREGCPGRPCLGCCVLLPICKDGMYMHAGKLDGEAGQYKALGPQCIGFASQPHLGGGLAPTLNVMERAGGDGVSSSWNTLAKVEGPMCFGGLSELCCSSHFEVREPSTPFHDSPLPSMTLHALP